LEVSQLSNFGKYKLKNGEYFVLYLKFKIINKNESEIIFYEKPKLWFNNLISQPNYFIHSPVYDLSTQPIIKKVSLKENQSILHEAFVLVSTNTNNQNEIKLFFTYVVVGRSLGFNVILNENMLKNVDTINTYFTLKVHS
jgi:hypothetical protein